MASNDNIELKLLYTSASANRHENGIKCLGRYILFSRANCPILFDIENQECIATLYGHSQQVNGQLFVLDPSNQSNKQAEICHIISTSYDRTAKLWSINLKERVFENIHTLVSPDESIFNTLSAAKHNEDIITITTTIRGNICLWKNEILKENINLKYLPTVSQINVVKANQAAYYFVFIAGTDNLIHIFQLDCEEYTLSHILDVKGHEDWIKSIEVINLCENRPNEFLVASASQDWYIRIWHMMITDDKQMDLNDGSRLKNSKFRLVSSLETVLQHENSVTGVSWFKDVPGLNIQLASCSLDKTVSVWTSSLSERTSDTPSKLGCATDGVWKEAYKFGETSEINLPFLSIAVSPLDQSIIFAQSLKGAIHCWKLIHDSNVAKPRYCLTGHSEAVTDLAWDKNGAYLLTASLDKTTRLHSHTSANEVSGDSKASLYGLWHEIARPQVHGHEINCVTSVNFGKFASGAEEKTIRVYGATKFFLESFKSMTKHDVDIKMNSDDEFPEHAQLPALGLSIRGATTPYNIDVSTKGGGQSDGWCGVSKLAEDMAKISFLDELPTEDILIQSTLWWETNKLYGHGNEIHALDCEIEGQYMASASKANRAELATILIWQCDHQFRKVASINHHSLTITRLRFSPNGKYLLSVSRDRTWCLSEKTANIRQAYKKLIGSNKANGMHERIIWDCCWTNDSNYFVTVSRDKKAILWTLDELVSKAHINDSEVMFEQVSVQKFEQSIQAVEAIPQSKSNSYSFVFGLEDGTLEMYHTDNRNWTRLIVINNYHQLTIRRIAIHRDFQNRLLMATGGQDGTVKVVELISKNLT